jgi:hypothetical protein
VSLTEMIDRARARIRNLSPDQVAAALADGDGDADVGHLDGGITAWSDPHWRTARPTGWRP